MAIWTTAGKDYAEIVVNELFKNKNHLAFIWTREKCTYTFAREISKSGYVKNLKKVKRKGFELEHVIMIDDSPFKLRKNYGNLIRVNR